MSTNTNGYLALLDKNRDEIKQMLPTYLEIDRFVYNAKTIAGIRELQDCSSESLYRCAIDAARRGLEIGGPNKHCAVVAFKSTAVLIVQWQGKAFLWARCGATRKLLTEVVYDGDEFNIERGDKDRIVHKPDFKAKRDPRWLNSMEHIVGAYAIAWLASGERSHSFVSQSQLIRTREWVRAKNKGELGFGWTDWLPEMCRKTAVHRLEGIIQPPPDMTPDQLEAWQRAGIKDAFVPNDDYEEAVIVGDKDGDNLPPPGDAPADAKAKASNGKPAEPKVEVKPDPPVEDRTLNREEQDRLVQMRKSKNMPNSALVSVLKKHFEVDDLELVNLKDAPEVEHLIETWANG